MGSEALERGNSSRVGLFPMGKLLSELEIGGFETG